jgi:hypothetical protein
MGSEAETHEESRRGHPNGNVFCSLNEVPEEQSQNHRYESSRIHNAICIAGVFWELAY